MKLTTEQAVNAVMAIEKTANKELPSMVAYRLMRIKSKLDPIEKNFEQARVDLVKKYGTEIEDKLQVSPENLDEFIKEVKELLSAEVDVETMVLNINDFNGIEIPLTFFSIMEPFITE